MTSQTKPVMGALQNGILLTRRLTIAAQDNSNSAQAIQDSCNKKHSSRPRSASIQAGQDLQNSDVKALVFSVSSTIIGHKSNLPPIRWNHQGHRRAGDLINVGNSLINATPAPSVVTLSMATIHPLVSDLEMAAAADATELAGILLVCSCI